jgi:hypothetical protein
MNDTGFSFPDSWNRELEEMDRGKERGEEVHLLKLIYRIPFLRELRLGLIYRTTERALQGVTESFSLYRNTSYKCMKYTSHR